MSAYTPDIRPTASDESFLIEIQQTLSVESIRRTESGTSLRIFDKSRIEPVACSVMPSGCFSKRPQSTQPQTQNWALKKSQTPSAKLNSQRTHPPIIAPPSPEDLHLNYPWSGSPLKRSPVLSSPAKRDPRNSILNLSLSTFNYQFTAQAEQMGFVCN